MPRITTLIAEIEAKLTKVYADDYPDAKLTFGFGAKDLDRIDGTPRLTWIPLRASFTAPEKQGKGKSVITRNPLIGAHCWGGSYDDAEELVHQLILALRSSAHADVDLQGEDWPPELHTHDGIVAVVSFSVKVPVIRPPLRTVQANKLEADTAGAAQGDGNLDWGEP